MKKRFLLLTWGALCLAAAGCSGGSNPSAQAANDSVSDGVKDSKISDEKAEDLKGADTNTGDAKTDAGSGEITIAEQVLYDQDGIKITATGFEPDGFMGPEIKLLLENTSEQNVTIQSRKSSVNGYMIDFQISADVAAGKKSNDGMSILNAPLKAAGITTLADIECSFTIMDSSTWETITDTDPIAILTSATGSYTQTYDDSGEVLYDSNDVKIISKGLDMEGSFMGPQFMTYIENNSDASITVQAKGTSVNGFMVTPTMSTEVLPGKKAMGGLTFMSSELEENSITKIEDIETSFHIFDSNSWDTIEDTDVVSISFK